MGKSRIGAAVGRVTMPAAALAVLLLGGPAASAAPVPSPDCPTPTLTAEPTTVSPGTVVTVRGEHFSGCLTADGALGQAYLPVTIGLASGEGIEAVLTTTQTQRAGGIFASVVIPDVPDAGATVTLAAESADPVNGLVYRASVPLSYSGGSPVPTAVPAGTGGLSGSEPGGGAGWAVAAGAGVVLAAGGVIGLRRRRAGAPR